MESTQGAGELTELIRQAMDTGGDDAVARLYREVAPALRRTAARYLRNERAGHTLQPTALLHDALLELLGREAAQWESREHFFAAMAKRMRWILARHARDRAALKREGGHMRLSLSEEDAAADNSLEQILTITQMLEGLEAVDERAAGVVEMIFFAGMTQEETAAALRVSVATVQRDWTFARAWLYAELYGSTPGD